jgi:hypothetical protein
MAPAFVQAATTSIGKGLGSACWLRAIGEKLAIIVMNVDAPTNNFRANVHIAFLLGGRSDS